MHESKSTKPQPMDGEGFRHGSDRGEAGEPYEYTPLPEPEPAESGQSPLLAPTTLCTRLVTIHPGEYDDDIVVDLSDIALKETDESQLRDKNVFTPEYRVSAATHLEQYEALSYVWGSPENPSYVFVGEEGRRIPITRNLDMAIRHLRYSERPRVVWVDALCIDQTSLGDKSRQVGHMNHIYWSTSRVVVWLGPEADDSDLAMNLLESIGQKIQVDWFALEYTCVTEEDEDIWGRWRYPNQLPLDERDWAAIQSLTERPWFKRIWVRQEVFKAGGEAVIYCGKSCASLDSLRRGLFRVSCGTQSIQAMVVLRPGVYSKLRDLRFNIRGAKCTDPKDYIYGVLGMLYESRGLAITPDYSKSLAEICQEVTLAHIDVYGSLALLDACGNDHDHCEQSSSSENVKLPSWVPNWACEIRKPSYLHLPRRVHLVARAEYLGDGILRVAGLMKGVIKDIIELDTTTELGFEASLRGIVPKDAAETQYPGGGSLWNAYRIALCANCFRDATVPADTTRSSFLDDGQSHAAFESILRGEEPPQSLGRSPVWPADSLEYSFFYTVWQFQFTHRFFMTKDGVMGWAPKQARQGDHIAIMLGSETPTVIRPVSSPETEQYEVVGPCYLQGFMFGEGFLGPFPEGVQPILHFKDENGTPTHFEFLDAISGQSFPKDPRLDAFLDPNQAPAWHTGEEEWHYRPDAEVLRSLRLDIQHFDLV